MSIWAGLRQFLYPSEFRIKSIKSFDLNTILKVVANLPDKGLSVTINEESIRFLSDLSHSLWRLEKKMLKSGTDQPLEDLIHAYSSLASVWNSLIQAGITVREHTGSLYDSGLPVTVIGYREIAELTDAKIIETIKPTVYLQGNPIRYGEVVLGIPPGWQG